MCFNTTIFLISYIIIIMLKYQRDPISMLTSLTHPLFIIPCEKNNFLVRILEGERLCSRDAPRN